MKGYTDVTEFTTAILEVGLALIQELDLGTRKCSSQYATDMDTLKRSCSPFASVYGKIKLRIFAF